MVRAAKTSGQCSIKMAEDKASPRFSIFLNKRMKGWWPLIKLKSQEDIEREEKEAEEAKKNKKKKKNSKHRNMKPEDLQFVDSSGSTYLLMVMHYEIIIDLEGWAGLNPGVGHTLITEIMGKILVSPNSMQVWYFIHYLPLNCRPLNCAIVELSRHF